jgi:nucleoside-triphosphatase THEP1
MKLAYTTSPGRGDMDLVLARVAERLEGQGLRVLGVVQINSACADDRPCDMDVKVLPDGPLIRISQTLGPQSRGCRLDPQGLEQAVGETAARLASGGDVLLVNKFGKQEAEGRGFRDVIAEALAADMAVIVGVNGLNLPRFLEFCGDMATRLPAEVDAIAGWAETALAAVPEDA